MKFQLYLDDSLVVRSVYPTRDGEFPDPRLAQSAADAARGAASAYRLRIEAQEILRRRAAQLVWSPPHETLEAEAVKAAQRGGRRRDVPRTDGASRGRGDAGADRRLSRRRPHGDRSARAAAALLERIVALGKPTVLVLLNGSAVAVNWAQDHVPAIVEAWYPGQAAGTAIADVLFGDYNPGGRLPVTFYKSVTDLPAFDDYRMAGRTYRFFKGAPLYPFGHGLSYTTFAYKNLRTSADRLSSNGSVTVQRRRHEHRRSVPGDEVVQLYAQHVGLEGRATARGSSRLARVTLSPDRRGRWSSRFRRHRWRIGMSATHALGRRAGSRRTSCVGASSADIRARARLINVVHS